MSLASPSLEVQPSVLISATPEAPLHNGAPSPAGEGDHDGCKDDHSMSGSGFIIPWKRKGRSAETLVVTVASWLSKVVELRRSMSAAQSEEESVQLSWRCSSKNPSPRFTVLMQPGREGTSDVV